MAQAFETGMQALGSSEQRVIGIVVINAFVVVSCMHACMHCSLRHISAAVSSNEGCTNRLFAHHLDYCDQVSVQYCESVRVEMKAGEDGKRSEDEYVKGDEDGKRDEDEDAHKEEDGKWDEDGEEDEDGIGNEG